MEDSFNNNYNEIFILYIKFHDNTDEFVNIIKIDVKRKGNKILKRGNDYTQRLHIAMYNHYTYNGMISRAIFMYGENKILEVCNYVLSNFGHLFNAMILTNLLSAFIKYLVK